MLSSHQASAARRYLFVSDLHLCETRPQMTATFVDFLQTTAQQSDGLYILGDLFEYWAGDDAIAVGAYREVIAALAAVGKAVPVYFIHGNRDFLIGEVFSECTHVTILPDPTLVNLFGKPVLLSHGDALCTDDVDYQKFRAEVRHRSWQEQFLQQPLEKRIAYIEQLRATSEREKSIKSMQIMDVNPTAVEQLLASYDYPPIFIHGHTHRPKAHQYSLAGHVCERWVLGDWYAQGSYLELTASGCEMHPL